jgi:hypothetical protein
MCGVGIVWLGFDEVPDECRERLRHVFAPVIRDLELMGSTVDIALDPRHSARCGCVLLPAGLTWEDVTNRGMSHPDIEPFFPYGDFDLDPDAPVERQVARATSEVQQLAIAMIWTRTGVAGWPLCPLHQTHPLWASGDRGTAVWRCPKGEYRITIGDLDER